MRGREAPIEVILVIDDVNTGGEHIAYERSEIDKFLRLDGGNLAHSVALAVFTDSGVKIQDEFTTDGKALSAVLDQYTMDQHLIPRSGGIYGAMERLQLSIVALHQIAVWEVTRPGRKIVLWISPGGPLLAGPSSKLNSTERQQAFTDIVTLSALLRQAGITLYSIDPLGTEDFANPSFHWQAFVNGLSKPSQAEWGDIALQVLAVQSGGLALTINNDLAGLLFRCLADTQAYCAVSFAPIATLSDNTQKTTCQGAIALSTGEGRAREKGPWSTLPRSEWERPPKDVKWFPVDFAARHKNSECDVAVCKTLRVLTTESVSHGVAIISVERPSERHERFLHWIFIPTDEADRHSRLCQRVCC